MLKKPCNSIGCRELIPLSKKPPYCEKHTKSLRKAQDRRRDPEAKKFYGSAQWKRIREQVLKAHNYMCKPCLIDKGQIVRATTVHHDVHVRDDKSLMRDTSNLTPLCTACHAKMHREKGGNHA